MELTIKKLLLSDLINDETEITVMKGNLQVRGRWYEDKILDHQDEAISHLSIASLGNTATAVLYVAPPKQREIPEHLRARLEQHEEKKNQSGAEESSKIDALVRYLSGAGNGDRAK